MIAITGATGLLGVYIIAELVQHGYRVRGLYRNAKSLKKAEHSPGLLGVPEVFGQVQWLQGHLDDLESLDGLMEGATAVIHAAAMVSFNPRDRKALEKVNIQGTAQVVHAAMQAPQVERFIHISSVAALGRTERDEWITEDTVWTDNRENSHYALTKWAAEMEVWRGFEEGLSGAIINPSIILGVGDWDTSSARLLQTVHRGFPFYSNGVNSVVDARDVARMSRVLLERADITGQRFIAAGPPVSYRELFYAMADAQEVKRPWLSPPRWMSNLAWRLEKIRTAITRSEPMLTRETVRSGHGVHRYDAARAREVLGVEFRSAEEILRDLVPMYLRDQRERS